MVKQGLACFFIMLCSILYWRPNETNLIIENLETVVNHFGIKSDKKKCGRANLLAKNFGQSYKFKLVFTIFSNTNYFGFTMAIL
jgi:hypothetical protein